MARTCTSLLTRHSECNGANTRKAVPTYTTNPSITAACVKHRAMAGETCGYKGFEIWQENKSEIIVSTPPLLDFPRITNFQHAYVTLPQARASRE